MVLQKTVRELAEAAGGELLGDGERVLTGVASLFEAGPADLSFVEGERFAAALAKSNAGAVIVPEGLEPPSGSSGIRVPNPVLAMAKAIEAMLPRRQRFTEVSPRAYIGENVELGANVGVGPGAFIDNGVSIGAGTEIYPGVTIGEGTRVGAGCILYSGVHIYHECQIGDRVTIHSGAVIGADGFGFAQEKTEGAPQEPIRHRKIPQTGTTIIEDDVEVGANSTIDRATLGATVIERGTKIDNLVMIGHNCRIGRHCLLAGQAGVAGSTKIGNYVTLAGQAGIADHLEIGDGAIVAAKTGVSKSIPPGQVVFGTPAMDAALARRVYKALEHLPEYRKTIRELKKRFLDGEEE